jgi:hypothetical protein
VDILRKSAYTSHIPFQVVGTGPMFRTGNTITAVSPKRPAVPGVRASLSIATDKRLAARTKPKRTLASSAS